jgi:succinate-semialdehyde dehydrogenase/glutarate-semialdehyde dehydrogenase
VGRLLAAQCAPTVKKLGLELGGNAPFIVFDDADVDSAVAGAMQSKYRNSGQTCVCVNRFLVQAGVHDVFVARLAEASAALIVGDGFEPGVQQGPLVSRAAAEGIERLVHSAVAEGARLVTGGSSEGSFFQPTVLTGVRPEMDIARHEIFGPVSAVTRFESDDEAIGMANATEYGLAAYFYTRDIERVWRVLEALEYGIVGVNTGAVSTEVAPFGGVKQSGIGREGGRAGLEEFMETKLVCIGGL